MIEGILRTIVIIWLVYYAVKLAFRLLIPWLLTKFVKHVQKQAFAQQGASSPPPPQPGEVTVEQTQDSSKPFTIKDGEYIDYEEIKQ